MFPFIVKYKKPLDSRFNSISNEDILNCIREFLEENYVDRIFIEDNLTIRYENDYLFSKRMFMFWNIWDFIFSGKITIEVNQEKRSLVYLFNTSGTFIFGAIIGSALTLFTHEVIVGICGFAFAGLLNWLILIERHHMNLSNVLNEVLKNNKNGQQKT